MADTLTYRYAAPSAVTRAAHPLLGLTTFTPDEQSVDGAPCFLSAFVERADVVAAGILAVADVAAARYYVPFRTIARQILAADPVVTYDGEHLRFESFSLCGGVHARFDVEPGGLAVEGAHRGTTNVDVNPPLRRALAALGRSDALRLRVGEDGLEADTLAGSVVEKRVPLPSRWVRGFAETQVIQRRCAPMIEIAGPEIQRSLDLLPARSRGRLALEQHGAAMRMATRVSGATVGIVGPERLAALHGFVRFADRLRVHTHDDPAGGGASSAWEIRGPEARLTITISPEPARGFSGEGGLLESLAADVGDGLVSLANEMIAERSTASIEHIAAAADVDNETAGRAVDVLAAAGCVGIDLRDGAGAFARRLPFGAAATDLNPRLATMAALLADEAVEFDESDSSRATVRSGQSRQVVRLSGQSAAGANCTCEWYARHQGARGPCKHVLAVVTARRRAGDG